MPPARQPAKNTAEFKRRSAAAKKGAETKRLKKAAKEAEKAHKREAIRKRLRDNPPKARHHGNSSSIVQRDLHLVGAPFQSGEDVRQLQLALNKISAEKKLRRHLTPDGEFGPHTCQVAKLVIYALGLRRKYVKAAGDGTVEKFVQVQIRKPAARTKDAHRRAKGRLKRLRAHQRSNDSVRSRIVANAKWGVSQEPSIHYQQSRPIDGLGTPHKLPLYTDCSGFATDCYKWAGAPDPNGLNYSGLGYTGTLLAHLPHIPKAEARPGDLVVFGASPGTHVVVLVEPGTEVDPWCVSHGQESGPALYHVSTEARAHAGQLVTYLKGV